MTAHEDHEGRTKITKGARRSRRHMFVNFAVFAIFVILVNAIRHQSAARIVGSASRNVLICASCASLEMN